MIITLLENVDVPPSAVFPECLHKQHSPCKGGKNT